MQTPEKFALTEDNPVLNTVLNSIHDIAIILDAERRIVFFNNKFKEFAEANELRAELGIKPGNAFTCTHALSGIGECGSTSFCKFCGGNQSLKTSRSGNKAVSSCRIAAQNGKSFDLAVSASPLEINGSSYTFLCITDVSAESRKQMLEKIFFHDVNNILNGMSLIMELLTDIRGDSPNSELSRTFDLLSTSMYSLKNEISAQHIITLAEKEELFVKPQTFSLTSMLSDVADFFTTTMAEDCSDIQTKLPDEEIVMYSDPVLLKRVVMNMVKNACEASCKGRQVTIGCNKVKESLLIHVNNPEVMNEKVKSSVFKRSFSTKGEGRGLGTYSMRLLTERYLKGNIYFTSEEDEGTTFIVKLPINLPYPQ